MIRAWFYLVTERYDTWVLAFVVIANLMQALAERRRPRPRCYICSSA